MEYQDVQHSNNKNIANQSTTDQENLQEQLTAAQQEIEDLRSQIVWLERSYE